ncbi:MAG UNVERIFIED_CONTAM: hypothetical protein LVR18_01075 [Planctomycetaceae bacterium]|jgi:hypothetical protein
MNARVNRLGAAIDTTISTPDGPVQVKFDTADNVTQFGGSARMAVAGFVDLSGTFGIEKQGETLLVGVVGVEAFLGIGGGTAGAIGLKVSNGNLGLVLKNGSYALTTSGDVGVVGLPGLSVTGTFNVRANQLGTSVNETVTTSAGSIPVVFGTGDKVLTFGGSAVISVAGIFEISGAIQATKTDSGVIFVDIPSNRGGVKRQRVAGVPDRRQGKLLDWWRRRLPAAGYWSDDCQCLWGRYFSDCRSAAVTGTAPGILPPARGIDDDRGRHRRCGSESAEIS